MRKKVTKLIALCAALLLVAASLAACGKSYTVDKVVMTYVPSPLNVPSVIEKEQGQFKAAFDDLGLDFEYSNLDSGADQTAALASGDIQILNAVGGASVILAAANDSDIVILSMYSRAPKAFAMYSKDGSINSPKALKGKTIAGPKGTNLHELLAAYLESGNMSMKDVDYVDMDIPSAVAALEGGSVDAALAGGPAAYNCEQSGMHKITDGEGLIAATICTATSKKFADENPEIISTFLKTQNDIVDYVSNDENRAEVFSTVAKALDLKESAVKDMIGLYDFSTEITDKDLEQLQDAEKFLYNNKMIEKHVDVKELIYDTE